MARDDHVEHLCMIAGMMMEDICADAISIASIDHQQRTERLRQMRKIGADIATLLSAAEILSRN